MICLFHLLHFSRFINKTDIRVHKPTSLNMVLIQEVGYKRDSSSDSLKSHSHEISNIYICPLIQVDMGTRAGYLLTDWDGKNILDPCITLPAPSANILFT
jgi:hypothetical protein